MTEQQLDGKTTAAGSSETPRRSETGESEVQPDVVNYMQNRELSWLRFNERVLQESYDETVPLLERLNFISIFWSNLAEFFMIRVGSLTDLALLKNPPYDTKSQMTPAEQIEAVCRECARQAPLRDRSFEMVETALKEHGIHRFTGSELDAEKHKKIEEYAKHFLLPVLSPQIVDTYHPFPHLENGALYIAVRLAGGPSDPDKTTRKKDTKGSPKTQKGTKAKLAENMTAGIIPIPRGTDRIFYFPDDPTSYILVEDIILELADQVFPMYSVVEKTIVCVTRNADLNPDDEAYDEDENYRTHIKKILKKRTRLAPVRLEAQGSLSPELRGYFEAQLDLKPFQTFIIKTPIDMGYTYSLAGHLPAGTAKPLLYTPFTPQESPQVEPKVPMFEQILAHDILLQYPYESMEPFLDLVKEAASDEDVMSIKITLYRIDRRSRLAEHLIEAAENGKEVTVLLELRARFDEENNVEWAERLEEAGCTVLYGFDGYKVHSKICLITRTKGSQLQYFTQLGTGNYNEKTAKIYTDYSYMTTDGVIGEDASTFFRNMQIGNLEGTYRKLAVAPHNVREMVFRGIDSQIEVSRCGGHGYLLFKMNSLTDRLVIERLSDASRAGVEIHLIIRGICCLLPGIKGATEGIEVRSIVGRFLEHSRVYVFGDDDDPTMYLSSADMMTRNNERRVEIAYPLTDRGLKSSVLAMLRGQLSDNVKAREMQSDGSYLPVPRKDGTEPFCWQEYEMHAMTEAAEKTRENRLKTPTTPVVHAEPRMEPVITPVITPATETVIEPMKPEPPEDMPLPESLPPTQQPSTVESEAEVQREPKPQMRVQREPEVQQRDQGGSEPQPQAQTQPEPKPKPEAQREPELAPTSTALTKPAHVTFFQRLKFLFTGRW